MKFAPLFAASLAVPLLASFAPPGLATPTPLALRADAWEDLDASSGGSVAVVVISCFSFSPDVVHVANGDLVEWHHADECGAFPHTVTNSGSNLVPSTDLGKPEPFGPFVGLCFDSAVDLGNFLLPANPLYAVDLDLNNGILVRDAGTADERACPGSNSLEVTPDPLTVTGVVPYFCRVHGGFNPPGEGMRGAIVITA